MALIQRPLYTPSSCAAIILGTDLALASRTTINGLNTITPPALDRGTFTVEEFCRVALTVAGLPLFGMLSCGGNFIFGDAGQSELADRLVRQEKFTDMQIKLVKDDNDYQNEVIMILDLANDPAAQFQVKQISPGAGTPNAVWPGTFEFTVEGLVMYATKHLRDDGSAPDITFVSPDTINAASSDLTTVAAVGDTIYVEDTAGANANFGLMGVVDTVAAGTITLTADRNRDVTTDIAGAATIILRAGRFGA